jgi:hypothetical protein
LDIDFRLVGFRPLAKSGAKYNSGDWIISNR